MNRPYEDLQFALEEWSADDLRIQEVLARATNALIAVAAFREAVQLRPTARLKVRHGARVIEDSARS